MLKKLIYIFFISAIFISCSEPVQITKTKDESPSIFPDYTDVTIPYNIAPLNFRLTNEYTDACAILEADDQRMEVRAKGGQFTIDEKDWKKLLESTKGRDITVTVCQKEGNEWVAYKPFHLEVSPDPVDPYIAYRLIEPGYQLWNEMGIYQRDLESYKQTAIMENKMTGNNCMNCHSFCMQDPAKMLFHMRATYPGTYMINGDKIEKLNTKTEQTISALVYPSWHPSGKYVAFSVNTTEQGFHMNDKNVVEVYDKASDVVIYDVEKHEIVTTQQLFSKKQFETFPTFSPDGKTLYFCSADMQVMPEDFTDVKYSLCAIGFDPQARTFGTEVDTLYNARTEGQSVSFPRISPDGKYLLYTLSGYGNFSIWHKDADLYMVNLETKENYPLDTANSDDVESYHSWSSNGKWIVFSSRRIDGLYTRPYFAHIGNDGKASKPFLLPQKDTGFYQEFMKSYNIPEFIKGEVKDQSYDISKVAKNDKGVDVRFSSN